MIDVPGIFSLSMEEYHRDPIKHPSLSASIAQLVLTRTPRHAWMAHPRLNPNFRPDTSRDFDIGNVAHTLLLGDGRNLVVLDFDSWRTNASKEAREQAYRDGQLPILRHQYNRVVDLVDAAKMQLANHREASRAFLGGQPEQTLVWADGFDTWFRARLDYMPDADSFFWDLKTTDRSADPASWIRSTLFSMQYDVQAAFYLRGIREVLKRPNPQFGFIVVETEPPYGLSAIALPQSVIDHADAKVEYAVSLWRKCLRTGDWPLYPPLIHWADSPAWEVTQWAERQAASDSVVDMLAREGLQ